jgi:hypothetical protein
MSMPVKTMPTRTPARRVPVTGPRAMPLILSLPTKKPRPRARKIAISGCATSESSSQFHTVTPQLPMATT